MGFFSKFPYSNAYQLNLDWIIAKIKKFEEDYNSLDPESFLRKNGGDILGEMKLIENALINANGRKIVNVPLPVDSKDAANKEYVDFKIGTPEAPGAYLPLAGGNMSGRINMDGNPLTGAPDAVDDRDVLPFKQAKDSLAPYLAYKFTPEWASTHRANNNVMNINTGGNFTYESMQPAYIATEDASTLINSPITKGPFYAIREVMEVPAGDAYHICVKLKELYPVDGREWTRMYDANYQQWTRYWKCNIEPSNMHIGTEYETSEFWKGKNIFKKAVSLSLATSGFKSVAISSEMSDIKSYTCYVLESGLYALEPSFAGLLSVQVDLQSKSFKVNSEAYSNRTAYAIVEYVK